MKSLVWKLRTAGLAAALALLATPALAAQPEDAWITTKVKMALLTDDSVDGHRHRRRHVRRARDAARHGRLVHREGRGREPRPEDQRRDRRPQSDRGRAGRRARSATEVADEELAKHVSTVLERDKALVEAATST